MIRHTYIESFHQNRVENASQGGFYYKLKTENNEYGMDNWVLIAFYILR